ncbi:mediator of RNA polymerase II transcription subunit 27-B [Lingula anatina]|uniref:Mediator of RNA polymerase II transcription subunit 27-B n=1 Tax=Lingula anatina TaxID=7574 RepID=A0A1S3HR82_LINAN|nr:mediator of RNA polymerase II transcription subunit 27-B-like [Lingula anatina]XP_013393454.1 mediator of RNA polymerase II transcription subunit 27-B [Lingula anatina]|eukprot:XP_013388061.1 mediator of RNA polymerase II transcription subunit 27-B-like [Lingula anatina]
MATDIQDLLARSLLAVRTLRSSVNQVFERFRNGMKEDNSNENKERSFLNELQQGLLSVNQNLGEVEKLGSVITAPAGPLLSGNSALLSLDPVLDKTPLHSQLLQAYKWSNKVHDVANHAFVLLNQNSLKRSTLPSGGPAAKRLRTAQQNFHKLPPQQIDAVIDTQKRMFPDLDIKIHRPQGTAAVLEVTVGRAMKIIIVLRGLILETVNVRGLDEQSFKDNGELDIWTKSKYLVYLKITEHACAALLHFYMPHRPDIAFRSFLTWLNSYTSLFTIPCAKCETYLQDNLPPTWREFRNLKPYHEGCRP